MGLMIEGKWDNDATIPSDALGHFIREASRFRHWITPEGRSGPSDDEGFAAEPGRYHLFVSPSCPWAHRTIIMRKLKSLENVVSMSIADRPKSEGWAYSRAIDDFEPCPDGVFRLYQVYAATDPRYTGKVTVPTLWDKKTKRIVNNESSEIIRMLNTEFNAITGDRADYYPQALRAEIDAVNERVYHNVNNGVYRSGFAKSQAAYEEAYDGLFWTLDWLEERLSKRRYLVGSQITEADWRLFPTLVRFDVAYFSIFKCNRQRIADYPNLSNYMRELYQVPGVAGTVTPRYYVINYYSIPKVNPTLIIPKGTPVDLGQPHDRERLAA
jgi:putative glutathione S-transferase